MRKICFVLRSHPAVSLGGAELQSLCVAEEFARRGWEVHYISEYKGSVTPSVTDNGVALHWIKARATGSGFLNLVALSRLLKQIKPEVIYQRAATDYTGIVRFLSKRHQVQYLWAASSDKDCQKAKYRVQSAHYKNRFTRLIRTLKFRWCDSLISYGIRGADLAIVQSEDQQRLIEKSFARSSTVVKNGFLVSEFQKEKSATASVLWVGNIKRLKRVDLFIDLAKACQNLPAKFIVIGRDSKDGFLTKSLNSRSADNLEYLGPLNVKQVENHLISASCLVNTSDYEGFPNTFIQAWMKKTPVISLNVDPDGVIKSHQLGFHSQNFHQMVRDVGMLLTDNQLRERMGENAYRYAINEHNICNTVNGLEKLMISIT